MKDPTYSEKIEDKIENMIEKGTKSSDLSYLSSLSLQDITIVLKKIIEEVSSIRKNLIKKGIMQGKIKFNEGKGWGFKLPSPAE